MSINTYTSCIKLGGVPLLAPLMTPKIREECLKYKRKAIEIEKQNDRDRLFKKCMEDLERLESQTKDLTVQSTLESQLTFVESPSHVPYETYNKLRNLKLETIDVSEYRDEGVKMIDTTPKLIRSNSYILESPSPILLAHLEKEARKCAETVESSTPKIEPQFRDVLDDLPQNHARNIIEILGRQQEEQARNQKTVDELMDDKTISMSISSQSLYYSFVHTPETPAPNLEENLNVVNLKHSRNCLERDRAASVIGAAVRGYLVRRLIQTEKVQGLIDTIKDALLCAIELHKADVIDESDVELHRRLIQQVSAACYAFHDIFFALSVQEQMGIIAADRQRRREKAKRSISSASSNNSRKSR